MQFTRNAQVYTNDHQPVGHITHVVLDPETKKVTHIVARQGLILTEDKVVPIEMFETTSPEGVVLRADVGDVDQLPRFEETRYVLVDLPYDSRDVGPVYIPGMWYPSYPPDLPTFRNGSEKWHGQHRIHRIMPRPEKNIPAGEVALKEGAEVITADDHRIGHIESVIVDPQTDIVTSIIVVKQVLLATRRWLVPVAWIQSVAEDAVYL